MNLEFNNELSTELQSLKDRLKVVLNDPTIHHTMVSLQDLDLLDRVIQEREEMLRHVSIAQISLSNALDQLLRRL